MKSPIEYNDGDSCINIDFTTETEIKIKLTENYKHRKYIYTYLLQRIIEILEKAVKEYEHEG